MQAADSNRVGIDVDHPKPLTKDEAAKIENDKQLVSEFRQLKLEAEAMKNWDLFYKRNSTHFFKDRHWTTREFEELIGKDSTERRVLLEVGCGVGNFVLPLLEERLNFFIFACDFSARAIRLLKENPLYNPSSCCAFQCDITNGDSLLEQVKPNAVDLVSMIFVLSAIHPTKMGTALKATHQTMKPGGLVLFRDYGLYDQAMLRFKPGRKLMENFYVRQDGTRAYYFSRDVVCQLFAEAGFEVDCCSYVERRTVNIKEGINVPRIFVQGKFRKPIT